MHLIRLPRAVTHLLVTTVAVLTAFADSAPAAQPDEPPAVPPPPIPVRFRLAEPAYVTLVIERPPPAAPDDAGGTGLRVRNLVSNTWYPAGEHTVWWDGLDESNTRTIHIPGVALYHRIDGALVVSSAAQIGSPKPAGKIIDAVMPPEGERLTREQIGVLRAWIDQRLAWPTDADVLDPRLELARAHWAFQPLRAVEPPAVKGAAWVRTPIDRFILAALEARGLQPTPPVDAGRMIRRVSFDLAGLPPDPADVENFRAAAKRDRPAAEAALVDRLLDSRHYGERWGRHWLDVARYADSDGMESDADRPHAYRYRDFVIRALDDDMPFDTFVRWQLAGDEIEPDNLQAAAATGFLTAGPNQVLEDKYLEEERLRNRYNELDHMLSTLGSGILGLTLGCARCHDHKYDAMPSREYNRMLSAVHSGDRKQVKHGPDGTETLVFRDFGGEPHTTWLFARGNFYDRDQPVELGFLDVLSRDRTAADYWNDARRELPRADTTYQRKSLAAWITDVDHGAGALAARVIVNRVWQHHFGEGLVRTVSDFGVRGEPPTHPELLEWLTHDFVTHGWKLKRLHRMILTSAVYQQGTTFDAAKAKIDHENRLLWCRPPQRLEAEILRDAMLAVSGTLNLEPYGPAFKPPISAEAMVARNTKTPYPTDAKDDAATRRQTRSRRTSNFSSRVHASGPACSMACTRAPRSRCRPTNWPGSSTHKTLSG